MPQKYFCCYNFIFHYQVTGVCNGQHPTIAKVLLITNDGSVTTSATNIELPSAMYNNSIIRADNVLMVQDHVYTIVVSLSDLDGAFGENSTTTFSEYRPYIIYIYIYYIYIYIYILHNYSACHC